MSIRKSCSSCLRRKRSRRRLGRLRRRKRRGEHKEVGFIAVSAGDGLAEIFRAWAWIAIIEGGQTMNPSTEDVVNAIKKVNADTVYVLPNNKNIILAANQAKYLVEDKNVVVVPTKTIPQGITAVINYVPDMGAERTRLP